jgi:hypothetical protein
VTRLAVTRLAVILPAVILPAAEMLAQMRAFLDAALGSDRAHFVVRVTSRLQNCGGRPFPTFETFPSVVAKPTGATIAGAANGPSRHHLDPAYSSMLRADDLPASRQAIAWHAGSALDTYEARRKAGFY